MRVGAYLVAAAISIAPTVAAADDQGDCGHPRKMQFRQGQTETTISDTVTRDDAEAGCYTFVARKGQIFDAAAAAGSTDNTAIVVFEPGYGPRKHDDFSYIDGSHLPGAGRDDDAHHVHAVLPATGRYLMMIGPASGGAAGYTVKVRIR